MDRRKFFALFTGSFAAIPLSTFAQQQPSNPIRIGFLGAESASNQSQRLDALREGLRELGYTDGKNIVIEVRWAEGKYERLASLAADLANLRVSVIVASGAKASQAAKRATVTIPIVIETGDAVAEGIVTNLARPEGNITGWTFFGPELTAKRLALLKECVPRITKVAYLTNPSDPGSVVSFPALRKAANELKLEAQQFETQGPDKFEETFATMARYGVDAVVVQGDTMFAVNAKAVAGLAIKYRLPSAGITEFAKAGGLIGNGVDLIEAHHKLALYVDRILKGARPSELPMEQATRFSLTINAKTAKALGIAIPPSFLLRADEVIQ